MKDINMLEMCCKHDDFSNLYICDYIRFESMDEDIDKFCLDVTNITLESEVFWYDAKIVLLKSILYLIAENGRLKYKLEDFSPTIDHLLLVISYELEYDDLDIKFVDVHRTSKLYDLFQKIGYVGLTKCSRERTTALQYYENFNVLSEKTKREVAKRLSFDILKWSFEKQRLDKEV